MQDVSLMSVVAPPCRSSDEERPDVPCKLSPCFAWGLSQALEVRTVSDSSLMKMRVHAISKGIRQHACNLW